MAIAVPPGEDHTKRCKSSIPEFVLPFIFLNRKAREDRKDNAKYFLTYSIISFAKPFARFALFAVQTNGRPKPSVPGAVEIAVNLV
jgi:hypothetical protein